VATTATKANLGDDIRELVSGFALSLEANNKSPKTVEVYLEGVTQLADFLAEAGAPTIIDRIGREHVELFLAHLTKNRKPATVHNRYRALRVFFTWCVDERYISGDSPMAKMHPPIVPEQPIPVPKQDDLKKLLGACSGKTFEQLRDLALLRFLLDSGCRAAEAINLRVDEIDLRDKVAYVVGKGRRPRAIPFGVRTAQALDRYIRARARHPQGDLPWLWISVKGRLTTSGLRQLMERRCDQAGIERIHPHVLRHHFAHHYLSDGGQETDLMQLVGWRSRVMVQRYASSTASERARANYREHSPGDRL
jgi:site-specific recombinase XerD